MSTDIGKTRRLLLLLMVVWAAVLNAQVQNIPTPPEVQELLRENNITEEEFRAAMLARGYDPNNIDIETVDLQQLEQVSMDVIRELSAQKAAEANQVEEQVKEAVSETRAATAEDISEAIDEGATPEEAVAEELSEMAAEELDQGTIFGHQLYRNRDLAVFRQADRIKPPRSYILGVGDVLSITINGLSQVSITAEISEQGFISIDQGAGLPKPSIPVRGLTLGQAEDLLRRRLKSYYRYNDNEFFLSVLAARTITVNFYGESNTVGGITISAVNTLFNALVAAGGPTDIGSVRRIRLISGSGEKVFDTYSFMQDPKIAAEFYMRDNDYVHIPVAEKVVSIQGAVRRPSRYELLDDENLVRLIEYAGGLTDGAYLKDIQITRYGEDQRVVANINLREIIDSGGDYILQAGDEIFIKRIEAEAENFVELTGAVMNPGQFERKDNMTLADLIDLGVLDDDARLDFGYLLRIKPDGKYTYVRIDPRAALADRSSTANMTLQDRDIVRIPSERQYSDDIELTVSGAVRSPGQYTFDPSGVMTIQDAILVSGGLLPQAADYGYILRRDPAEPKRASYIPFNPQIAINDPSSTDNHVITPFDIVVVFNESSLRDEFFVQVSGAVRSPGELAYNPDLTISQALRLAGGLSFSAATNRIDVSRVIFNKNEPTRTVTFTVTVDDNLNVISADTSTTLLPFDRIYVRNVPQFELQRTVRLEGELMYPGTYAIIENNERLVSFIERAGGLTPEAYADGAVLVRNEANIGKVVIDLGRALDNPNSSANLILAEGDVINVPKQKDLVTITGAVNLRDLYTDEFIVAGNRVNVAYEAGKNAKYYIDNFAAGLAEDGRKRLITVEQPSGRVDRTRNILFFKKYPKVQKGATVSVGRVLPKPEDPERPKEEIDWGAVVRDTLAQATAILTLILLVDRL